MKVARAGAVAVLAACSTGEPARPGRSATEIQETRDFGSGARLQARAWEIDGALVLRDFFDVELGEACSFVENGTWHVGPGPSYWCLPVGLARHDAGFGPFATFSDSACTRRVAVSPPDGPAAYAVVRAADACAAPPSVHSAGEPKMLAPWIFDGTACRRISLEIMVQALGGRIPLASFVRAEEVIEDRGSRIASLVAVTGDGARMTFGGFDRERNEAVRVEEPRGSALRWVPARVAFEGAGEVLFGDPGCASSVSTKIARDAVCPLTAALVFEDDCGSSRFHDLGPPIDRARLRSRDEADACVPYEGDGVLAYERGPAVPPAKLAPAFVVEAGGEKVRRRGYSGPGGAVAMWGELVDAVTREPCAPTMAHDGTRRCLPLASADVTLFADEACATPAFEQPVLACDVAASPSFVQASSDTGARVFEVTGERAELFETSNGTCRRHMPLVPSRGFTVREVDVRRFAPVSERELP